MEELFRGKVVLELANVLAGPSVGQFFAELGAEVIKVENPKTNGDVTRSWLVQGETCEGGVSAYFTAANWGKKSIGIDITHPNGLSVLHQLIEKVDIVIASYKPGDAQRLGVSYADCSRLNPSIIYGAITGYGEGVGKVGYDAIIQAESGFMSMNGEPEGQSLKMPVALVDVLAAHQLKEAILLAWIQRMQSGKGAYVSVSLLDTAIASLANQATQYLVAGKTPVKMGAEHPSIAPYGKVFSTKDESEVILAIGNDKQFKALMEVLQLPIETQFSTNPLRVENRKSLNEILSAALLQWNAEELLAKLEQARVPAGKLRNVRQVFEEGLGEALLYESEKGLKGVRNFIGDSLKKPKISHILPPPVLFQHTNDVISHFLGYSDKEIAEMHHLGVLALPDE